jgi:C1A family cysteine protease
MAMNRKYGWVRDLADHHDRPFRLAPDQAGVTLPRVVDLRPQCPPVYDQGELGSCTANAIAAALQFDAMRQGLPSAPSSRLFIYFNERDAEGTTAYDSGAQIRDGIKSVVKQGDCPESEWPYDVSQFATRPPQACYDDAVKHLALSYEAVDQDLNAMRACLAAGFPFVFGFTVYQSFESERVAQSGVVPMPGWFDRPVGGHAVTAVGYNDANSYFCVRNSWGPDWGDQGYFYFPYAYMLGRQASDFWTIRTVE